MIHFWYQFRCHAFIFLEFDQTIQNNCGLLENSNKLVVQPHTFTLTNLQPWLHLRLKEGLDTPKKGAVKHRRMHCAKPSPGVVSWDDNSKTRSSMLPLQWRQLFLKGTAARQKSAGHLFLKQMETKEKQVRRRRQRVRIADGNGAMTCFVSQMRSCSQA